MMRVTQGATEQLRRVIDRLPLETRRLMLEGIDSNRIVVGGNYDLSGGVCPMVAADRRASAGLGRAFGRAWDRYGHARLPRRATERELRTLRTLLVASIETDHQPPVSLSEAISSHKALVARRASAPSRSRPDTGERSRTGELRARGGWAWVRPARTYEAFEAALALAEEQLRRPPGPEDGLPLTGARHSAG